MQTEVPQCQQDAEREHAVGGEDRGRPGPRAQEVADVPAPWLDVRVVGSELGTASAIKMCTASYYKGRVALAAHALLTAEAHGVTYVVLDDLGDLLLSIVPPGEAEATADAVAA